MTTNASPKFDKAQEKFLNAIDDEERLNYLEEMIREAPKHKSSENLLSNLRTRRRKLEEKLQKLKKHGKTSKRGIKKEEMQAVILGFTNTGKSTLLSKITNVNPLINFYEFTTKEPLVGMMNYEGTQIQLIEIPAVKSEFYDRGLVNNADTLVILINKIEQIKEIEEEINNQKGKIIILFNLKEGDNERKISETLKSKKYNFVIYNLHKEEDFLELKEKLFLSFDKIRIFTKEPGKRKTEKPIILKKNSTVRDVAEEILKGFSNNVKETFLTGPSSKFPNQKVGLNHILKDLDIVEFKTK
jgi:hypothetical protein